VRTGLGYHPFVIAKPQVPGPKYVEAGL
jgi:hypothetical protein